ncbi:glutamine-hydrolyzing carbamoyl-phosphate synthase small subunit [Spirochaeta lutea]|uniref:Carbamoyl phosphate synthase small chain n=1 Tax=Spirochaeta lutea TaxID=1480694 RepID=A0A098R2J1_9SPIO|nr:glutamine-hydrolyzing carbamoyl-phosphate synthase small subunit [Spirochaeta lutea]KGE73868.1 hypothetical protein DC28_01275 [Spirochaeta lutea]
MNERTYLLLEDGTVYTGEAFGYPAPLVGDLDKGILRFSAVGEVVFNTAMSGYHEVLTDPSYTGQLITMTYPHIGNYGAQGDWNESSRAIDDRGASCDTRPVKAAGFIVRSLYRGPVPKGRITLDAFLNQHGIPGISGIDTRELTLALRDGGSQKGLILRSGDPQASELSDQEKQAGMEYLKAYPAMEGLNLVPEVGTRAVVENPAQGGPTIALLDCGVKANIVREFNKLGCRVVSYPATASAEEILSQKPQGVMISNGPGDPATLDQQIQTIKKLIGRVPVFGICLGHQLIAQAVGAKTYKMKFGHHGINHPVRDERTKKVFVTSQNHGFAVDEASLPDTVKVWFRNANDHSNEGIYSDELRIYSAQFHPESAPGPYDSLWIFEAFLQGIPGYSPSKPAGTSKTKENR